MRPVADGETRPSSFEVSAAGGAGAPEGTDVHCYLKCSCSDEREKSCYMRPILTASPSTSPWSVRVLVVGGINYDKGTPNGGDSSLYPT